MDFLPFFPAETWALLVIVIGLLLLYGTWPHRVFRRLGIPGPTPIPFLGTAYRYQKGITDFDKMCYEKYGRFWGFYDGRQAVLGVTDPAIIKTMLVKECNSIFTNRRNLGPLGKLRDAVSVAKDEHWKRIRTVLSPTFTSGKLKDMLPLITHHTNSLVKHFQKKAEHGETVDIKEILGAFSMDVVTSTSFGVNTDSLNNPKDPFVKQAKKLVRFDLFSPIFVTMYICPFLSPLLEMLKITVFPSGAVDFFGKAIKKIKQDRKQGEKGRVDFLRLMMDSERQDHQDHSNGATHSYKGLTEDEILAQAVIFIFAGYEATSNILTFLAYELAIHPDVQQKLQDEIDTVLPNKAPFTYETLMQMEYLDMAVNEALRKYPIGGRIERVCKKDVEISGITIPKGTVVMTPPSILHYLPEYWPEPHEFRPERFSKENSKQINPYVYLPFGAGPRNCIGMRFALLVMKAAVVSLLQRFTLKPCKETQIPLVLVSRGITRPEKPIILKVESRVTAA